MRNPTKEEIATIEKLHLESKIAGAEHDLIIIGLREKYSVVGKETMFPIDQLSDDEKDTLVKAEAKGRRLQVQLLLAEMQLRKTCEVPVSAKILGAEWINPATRKLYIEREGESDVEKEAEKEG